ncbi:MAG: trimethylamine-N-oxide reductase TorA [Alphaproteobacteria bacterium]
MKRRDFLKTTAFGSGVLLVSPSLFANATATMAGDGVFMNASHWGAFKATVKDGKWVGIRAWENDPMPSHQLEGVLDVVYSPSRIKYPMVRRAFLEKGKDADRSTRGQDDFVRVSWDEALDLVAAEVTRVQNEYGPKGLFAGSYGWKSPGKLHNCRVLLSRCLGMKGGFVNHVGDYSTGAAQVIMPHVVGTLEVYEQQTAWPNVVENTECLVLWGADPYKTAQIGWVVPDHGYADGLEAYKQTGKEIISIDPINTKSAKHLGAEWVSIRPQTDVAMMLGMAHTLVDENLVDEDFIAEYTTGYDQFLPYLMGEMDGTPKTAEWAAEICDVPAEQIKALVRKFKEKRTMLASGWGIQRMHHGEQAHWMLVTLAAMLGQIGLPGGGFGLSYHYSSGGSPTADGVALSGISSGGAAVEGAAWLTSEGAAAIPLARIVDMLENPGAEFDFNGTKDVYPDVKMAYWVGGNPFAHHQDRNRMVKAWEKLETFIVHDFQWTATARHADIVLPATTAFERNDIEVYGDYSGKAIVAMQKLVEPMYESKSDFEIFTALSERFGFADKFTESKSEMEWLKEFYNKAYAQAEARNIAMLDFDTFWAAGMTEFKTSEEAKQWVRYGEFREDPLLNPLGTPSGMIEIYSKNIEKMGYDDCKAYPSWMEPLERVGRSDSQFPLHVNTGHPESRLHSQLCGTKLRETYAVNGREPMWINPKTAEARGINDGDIVRVYNERGQILAGAVVTEDIREDTIWVAEGGWYNPVEPGVGNTLDAYGDVNVLTPDIGTSKLAQGNCGHTVIADVEKFTGEVPELYVFSAPTNG